MEEITVKDALREARVMSGHLYKAIRDGQLRSEVVLKDGKPRRLISRDSFDQWKRRLDARRRLLRQARLDRNRDDASEANSHLRRENDATA